MNKPPNYFLPIMLVSLLTTACWAQPGRFPRGSLGIPHHLVQRILKSFLNNTKQLSELIYLLTFGEKTTNIAGFMKTVPSVKNHIYRLKLNWHLPRRGKSTKQKMLEMVEVTVPIFFYFDEIWKMKQS